MIHTPLTNKALRFAYKAHHGRMDDFGLPYIFHPYNMAEQMPDEITTCVALLHDTVEHTDVTFENLEEEFPKEVVDSVRRLTHGKGDDYMEYVRNLSSDPVARTVKLADLEDNSDLTRAAGFDGFDLEEAERDRERYARARTILLGPDGNGS